MSKTPAFISAGFGFAAAIAWLAACFVRVPHKAEPGEEGYEDGGVLRQDGEKIIDPFATSDLQNKVNAAAAFLTAIAVGLQAWSAAIGP